MAATTFTTTRPDTLTRILDAAFACIGDVGLGRTTVEDVARAARLSRQTIYRYFPSKEHLIMALVLREEEKFLDGVRAAFAVHADLRRAMFEGTRFCLRFAREHPLLDRLLATDAGTLLPYLTTRSAPILRRAEDAFTELLRTRSDVRGSLVEAVADTAARVVVSYALSPPDRDVDDVARDLATILAMTLARGRR